MKEFKIKAIEIHTKIVTHSVFADTPEEAETKIRNADDVRRSHTRIEQSPTKKEVVSVISIKDTGKF